MQRCCIRVMFHSLANAFVMQGFGDRLLNEVKRMAVKDVKIKIYAPPERKYSTWIGGSILAGLNTFKKVGSVCCAFARLTVLLDVGIGGRIPRRPRDHSQESWLLGVIVSLWIYLLYTTSFRHVIYQTQLHESHRIAERDAT